MQTDASFIFSSPIYRMLVPMMDPGSSNYCEYGADSLEYRQRERTSVTSGIRSSDLNFDMNSTEVEDKFGDS